MRIGLAYGSAGLEIEVPDDADVVVPRHRAAASDSRLEVLRALRHPVAGKPLREIAHAGQTVAISVCDGTRPQPRSIVIPAILEELSDRIRLEDIVVLVATGTHRANTPAELETMFGSEVIGKVSIENHDAFDAEGLRWVGTLGAGVPVSLCRRWLEADIRITTGFVEPHFFAGFSGGPKMVAPGLAAIDTVLVLHDAHRISHPQACWGVTVGNPIHDDVRAIAAATGVDFALDVVLNREQRVVRAFGGEMFAMHRAACQLAKSSAMAPVARPYEVVVTTNAGAPLDQNLYQSVKGMSAAAQVIEERGTIICAAACNDGLPDHGEFKDELRAASDPNDLLKRILGRETTVPDQWQAQIFAEIKSRADVLMFTDGLTHEELHQVHLEKTDDIAAAIRSIDRRRGRPSRICVLPEGPTTIPYIA
jgi:nickel-dependent lactate racemase